MRRLLAVVLFAVVPGFSQAPAGAQKQIEELERIVAAQRRILLDWGGLVVYGSDNSELKKPAAGVNRVVFLGDDITEHWGEGAAKFFPGKPYLNRGISRQTTGQMLVRFRQDVIELSPAVVVIQAGSNDIGRYAGPQSEATIADNIISMVELAKLHGIQVVLASVTPVCDCGRNWTGVRSPGRIMGLNSWMKNWAAKNGVVYLNYYEALAQGRTMKPALTVDGLVPNDAGYEVLSPIAEKAIAEALGK